MPNPIEHAHVIRPSRVGFRAAACLLLLPALMLTQELQPCPAETQSTTVANTDDAATLASMLECSNGSFAVEWFGDVVISKTIYVTQGTSLNITGATSGAKADGDHTTQLFVVDGASSLHLTDMILANGDAYLGGAVQASGKASISFGGKTTFVANAASFGGAVYAELSSSVSWESGQTTFSNNYALYYGGAMLAIESSVLSWYGETHFLNNSASYAGGAVFATESSMSWTGETMFTDNTAWSGGAIYAVSSSVVWGVEETMFYNNNASGYHGGAIMAEISSSISWDGVALFIGNGAQGFGGAVYTGKSSNVFWDGNATFTSNSGFLGGAIVMEKWSNISWKGETVFMDNDAIHWGGGVYVQDYSSISWTGNTTFLNNSGSDGGGLMIFNSSVGTWSGDTTFARNMGSDGGGGLNVNSDSNASWTGVTSFIGNMGKRGGAMFVWNSNLAWTESTTFADNVADLDGGAVYATIEADIRCQGSTAFLNNTAATGNGGALSVHGSTINRGSYVEISDNATFVNNFAFAIGGAVHISASAGPQYFEGVEFRSNSAGIGGALAVFGGGNDNEATTDPTTCWRCLFINNMAASSGLAVAAFGYVDVNGSYFHGNAVYCEPGLVVEEVFQNASGTARYETVCAGCMSLSVCENCTVDNSDYNPICSAVPEHTFADKPGTRLEALRIEEGYWRATRESAIILSCYNEAACLGGQTGAETFCKTGYTGAYCSVCQGGYSPSLSKTCTRCSHSRRQWFVAVATIGGIVIVCAAVISSAYLVSTNFEEEETTCFSNRICRRVPVQAFKSVVVVWQILTQFESVANITYPGVYQAFSNSLNFINLDIGLVLSAGCLWPGINFHDRFIAGTIWPLAVLGWLTITYSVALHRNSASGDSVQEKIRNKHLSAVILLLFFVYSSVSSTVFQMFACDSLDDGNKYLRADYQILCTDEKHKSLQIYAGLLIALYPVGIPLLFAVLLYRHRDVLAVSRANKTKAQSIASLWAPYRPNRFYSEVIECARRIMLTGVVVFIYPNDTAQIAITLLNSFLFLVVFEVLSPYKSASDTWVSRFGHILIFFTMFDVLLLRVDVSQESSESQKILAGVLVAGHLVMIVVVVAEAIGICYASTGSGNVLEEHIPSQRRFQRPTIGSGLETASNQDLHTDGVLWPSGPSMAPVEAIGGNTEVDRQDFSSR